MPRTFPPNDVGPCKKSLRQAIVYGTQCRRAAQVAGYVLSKLRNTLNRTDGAFHLIGSGAPMPIACLMADEVSGCYEMSDPFPE
jgi:hypothetical protein